MEDMQVCCTGGPLEHAGGWGSEADLENWERQRTRDSCTPGRLQPGQPEEGSSGKMAWAGECRVTVQETKWELSQRDWV